MANTYTQIHIQLIFAVKFREAMISKEWNQRLHQYMTGIFQANNHKILQINSVPDHIHIFGGFRCHQSISDIVKNVKTETTKWIKAQRFCRSAFAWQEGYGAFSYSKSHIPNVIKYIQNQEAHHKKISFRQEYENFLRLFEIEYDENYLFIDPL